MKVTDLMIGDYICLDGDVKYDYPIQVQQIGYQGNNEIVADNDVFDVDDIHPIPLTEEILAKNGWDFSKCKHGIYCKEDKFQDAELSRDDNGFYWSYNTDEYEILRVDYVHQLQHLLRLCGIEKELTI